MPDFLVEALPCPWARWSPIPLGACIALAASCHESRPEELSAPTPSTSSSDPTRDERTSSDGSNSSDADGETGGGPAVVEGDCATIIEDPALAAVVWEELELPPGSPIPSASLAAMIGLPARGRGITTLAGLECATGLSWVALGNPTDVETNSVTDLTPLMGLLALETIALDGNTVADLSPLGGLAQLQSLSVVGTQVSDLGPLVALGSLQYLDASNTLVEDLSPIADLVLLERLAVAHTPVYDIGPVAGLTSIESLVLDSTLVADLAPLGDLPSLAYLYIRDTPVDDFAPLTGLQSLEVLRASSTGVTDIEPLLGAGALRTIDVEDTEVADVAALAGLPSLDGLHISRTLVADITAFSGTTLTQLSASDNAVDALPSDMPMVFAELAGNGITDITPLLTWDQPFDVDLARNEIDDVSPLLDIPWFLDNGSCLRIDLTGNPLSEPDSAAILQAVCTDHVVELVADRELGCRHRLCGVVDS